MGRIFGILMFVLVLWTAIEISNEGMRGAFGGALAFLDDSPAERGSASGSVVKRAGDRAASAYREAEERRERLIGDAP